MKVENFGISTPHVSFFSYMQPGDSLSFQFDVVEDCYYDDDCS
jgi:hypothetical protein